MSEESVRMLALLQELSQMKDARLNMTRSEAAELQKRRKQIRAEMKQLAQQKKRENGARAA